MKKFLLTVAALAVSGTVLAKIPAPVLDDAAKAKAAETAAKAAWQGKVDGYNLCKSQDRVAAAYKKSVGAKPAAAAPAAAASAPAVAACVDPGPFAYAAPGAPASAPAKTAAAAPAKKP